MRPQSVDDPSCNLIDAKISRKNATFSALRVDTTNTVKRTSRLCMSCDVVCANTPKDDPILEDTSERHDTRGVSDDSRIDLG